MAKSRHRIKDEYLLMPYGSLTTSNHRFVAEMILNQDGDELLGIAAYPDDLLIPLHLVGATGKLIKKSNGVYVKDIVFLTNTGPRGEKIDTQNAKVIRTLLEQGMAPKPLFTGTVNKKLRIVTDCRVIGFYIGPSQNLRMNPTG